MEAPEPALVQRGNRSADLDGRTLTQVDPRGNTMTNSYDAAGRMTNVTDAVGNQTQYGYDAASQLRQVTDALSQITAYPRSKEHSETLGRRCNSGN